MPPALSPVVKVTGFRDASPHGGAVVLKLYVTWRIKAGLIHLHHLASVLRTHTLTFRRISIKMCYYSKILDVVSDMLEIFLSSCYFKDEEQTLLVNSVFVVSEKSQ